MTKWFSIMWLFVVQTHNISRTKRPYELLEVRNANVMYIEKGMKTFCNIPCAAQTM